MAVLVAVADFTPRVEDLQVCRDAGFTIRAGGLIYPAGSGFTSSQALPFTYPPIAALLFLPLSFLPLGWAAVAWWALSFAALMLAYERDLSSWSHRWAV